jgi:RimJ/RimL family protein N-acetyltransferase
MSGIPTSTEGGDWRRELPTLRSERFLLREPDVVDVPAIMALLSSPGSIHFGIDTPGNQASVRTFAEELRRARESGTGFGYALVAHTVVGLFRVRPLGPAFEAADWECTLLPEARGTGMFVDAARLVLTFAFDVVGVHRLEARVPAYNGRALGALRKLGAVQEGLLRKSLRLDGTCVDQTLWSILRDDLTRTAPTPLARVH